MGESQSCGQIADIAVLVGRDERDPDTLRAGAAGPADAMDIALGVAGRIEIDHVRDSAHVDTARGDVGGHERVDGSGLETGEGQLTLAL